MTSPFRLQGQLTLRREHAAVGDSASPADMLGAAVNLSLSLARLAYRTGIPGTDEAVRAAAADIMAAAEHLAALIELHITALADQRRRQITEQQQRKVTPA